MERVVEHYTDLQKAMKEAQKLRARGFRVQIICTEDKIKVLAEQL